MRILQSLLMIFFTLISINSVGQIDTIIVKGILRDTISNVNIEGATIVLHNLSDTSITLRKTSNKNGFIFYRVVPGNYLLISDSKSYLKDSQYILVKRSEINLTIILHPSFQNMEEIVVKATPPAIRIKGDTTIFNASAFAVPLRSNVEDLLRKLPGLQIDKDGKITVNGQSVDKIKIDGKDIFLGNIITPSKMLPSDIVAQIETYDSHSEKSDWTGIKDTTGRKTINLTLKANRKTGVFGTATVSLATENRYAVLVSATRMSPSKLLMFNLSSDNTTGIQTGKSLGLNYRNNWGKKIAATLGATYNHGTSLSTTTTQKTTFLMDSTLNENRYGENNAHSDGLNLNENIEYKIDQLHEITLTGNNSLQMSKTSSSDTLSVQTKKPFTTYLSSLGKTNNTMNVEGYNTQNTLNYKQRFKKSGSTIFATIMQSYQQQGQPTNQYSLINIFDSSGNNLNNNEQKREFKQVTNNSNYNISAAYNTQSNKGHLLQINYNGSFLTNQSVSKGFQFDTTTNAYTIADSISNNHFVNSNNTQSINGNYAISKGKFRYGLSLNLNSSVQKNINSTQKDTIQQKLFNWLPSLGINYDYSHIKTFGFSYSGTTISPTSDQLRPVPDLSNPYLIKLGNPNLKQASTHNISLNFNNLGKKNSNAFRIMLTSSFNPDKIVMTTTTLTGGVQQQEYVNVNGVYNVASSASYGFSAGKMVVSESLKAQSWGGGIPTQSQKKMISANVSLSSSYGQDVIPLYGQFVVLPTLNTGGGFTIEYNPTQKLIMNFTSALNHSNSKGTINYSQKRETSSQNYALKLNYSIEMKFSLAGNFNFSINNTPERITILKNGSVNLNYEPSLKFKFTCNYNFQIDASPDRKASLQTCMLDFNYELPLTFRISSSLNFQVIGSQNQTQSPAKTNALWNAFISKEVFGNHGGLIKLSANDILNRSSNFAQTQTTEYLITTKTNVPGKLILLSFSYNFRKFPVSKTKSTPPVTGKP